MKREDLLVASLAGLSVVLVVLIVVTMSGRGPALAQDSDRGNGFVLVTTRFDENRDSVALIDERSGQMATFIYVRGQRTVTFSDVRDLRADFGIPLGPVAPPERPEKPEKPEK